MDSIKVLRTDREVLSICDGYLVVKFIKGGDI
jgi:hypothetical protein